jgi:hypothetical protein
MEGFVDQIAQILDMLGERLSEPAEAAFTIMVQQQVFNGYRLLALAIVFGIISLGVITWGVVFGVRRSRNPRETDRAAEVAAFFLTGTTVGLLLMAGASVIGVAAAAHFANPAYYVIQDLLRAIPG